MIPIHHLSELRPRDVLIHPTRGGALVDRVEAAGVHVELAERLDRARARLGAEELAQGWRLAAAGGLFEGSVLHHEETMAQVADQPGQVLLALTDELDQPTTRELAATWLVSRGLLAPGRALSWWAEATEPQRRPPGIELDAAGSAHLAVPPLPLDPPDEAWARAWASMPARQRHRWLSQVTEEAVHAELLRLTLEGRVAELAILMRWAPPGPPPEGLDRLMGAGHLPLLLRCCAMYPRLAARHFVEGLRGVHAPDAEEAVLRQLPLYQRAVLLLEMAEVARGELDLLDRIEGLIEDGPGAARLIAMLEDGPDGPELRPPAGSRWTFAERWLRERSADATVEMPSLHPSPLLQDLRELGLRDCFPLAINLARALATSHAAGRSGGLGGARVDRDTLKVRLGPDDGGTPDQDVRNATRLLLGLALGLANAPTPLTTEVMLAHAGALRPNLPPDWLAALVRLSGAPGPGGATDGLRMWTLLEQAQAIGKVREAAPKRPLATVRVGWDTHIGASKARLGQTNQDAQFFHTMGALTLLVVADGISTSTAGTGNLASALLIQVVAEEWEASAPNLQEQPDTEVLDFLKRTLARANQVVCEAAVELAEGRIEGHIPMGTTAVLAVMRHGRAMIASLGDSRAYLVSHSGLAQLTGDANLRGERLTRRLAGDLEEIEGDPSALTTYVGHFDREALARPCPPQLVSVALLPEECLMLCTDGLTDYAAAHPAELDRLVRELLAGQADLSAACRALVNAANAGGGGDNVTVLIARQEG